MRSRYLLCVILLFPVLSFAQTITYPGTLNLCPASTKLLTATGFAGGSTFQWRKDGANISGATLSTYNVNAAGSYDVIVTTAGIPTTYTAVILAATTNPVPDFTFAPSGDCASVATNFTNASTGNTALTYLWDFGDVNSGTANASTATSPSRSFTGTAGNSTQNFSVKLTATDADGCTANVTKTVIKKQMPSTVLSNTTGKKTYNNDTYYTVCGSGSGVFSFTNASTTSATNTNYQFVWGNGNPDFSSGTFVTTTQTYNTGVYTLNYSVTGGNGCVATVTHYVFVGTNPSVGTSNPGGTDVCTGQTLTFPINNTAGNTTGTTYTIDFGDGTASVVYNHPAPADISHVFNTNSCGFNNLGYNNSFFVRIVAANACQTSTGLAVPIFVSEKPVAAFTLSASSVCTNTNVSFAGNGTTAKTATNTGCTPGVSVWTVTPSTGFTVQSGTMGSENASVDPADWTSGSDNLTLRFTAPGTYSIKLKTGNTSGCGSDEITKTVCVNGTPTASFTIDQSTGCSNLAVVTTNTSSAATCGSNTYAWTVAYSATSGCSPSTSSFTYTSGSATSTNPQLNFINPGTYTLGLVNTVSGGCASTQATRTITVKSKPVVNLTAASSICVGNTSPSITVGACSGTVSAYAWTLAGATPASAATLSPGTINYATAGSYTIAVDVTNECGVTSASQGITVKTPPDITVPANLIRCHGTTTGILSFSSTAPGTTFAWTNNTTSVGLGSSGTGSSIPSFTANNTTAAAVTATITVTPTSSGCPGPAGSFTLTANPRPSAPAAVSPTYCQNATAVALTATAGTGNTLTWYNNAGLTGGSATAPTPSTTTGGTTNYYVTQDNSFGCTSNASTISVVVTTAVGNNTISANQTICAGSSAAALTGTAPSGGTGSFTYQWQSSTDGGTVWSNATGTSTSSTYSPGAVAVTTMYRRNVSSGACVAISSNNITVTVDPALANTGISASQSFCQGTATALLTGQTATGGNGTISYVWESSLNNTSWSAITGAAGTDYQPPLLSVSTYYRRTVSSGTCSVSTSVLISVTPTVGNNTISASQIICLGATVATLTGTSPSGGTGSFTYQWQSSTDGGTTWANATGSSTSSSYSPGAISVTTSYRRQVSSGACIAITSNTITITVDPALANTGISANQSLCQGTATALLSGQTATGGNGTISYLWESSLNNASWSAIAGATGVDYQPPLLSTSTYYRRTVSSGSCSVTASVLVTVTPTIGNNIISANQIICLGTSTVAPLTGTTPTGGTGSFTYQWQSSTDGGVTWANATGSSTSSSYSPGAISVTTSYRRQVSSGACVAVSSNTITVTVDPALASTGISANQSLCQGTATALLSGQTATGGNGTISYLWESSLNNSSWSAIAGATGVDYQPPLLSASTYYRRTVSSGSCSVTASVQVSITSTIGNNTISANQIICSGTSTVTPLNGTTPTGGTGTFTYQWQSSTDGGTTWTNATGSSTSSGYSPGTVSVTTSYRRNVSSGACTGISSNAITITIQSSMTNTAIGSNQDLCEGDPSALLLGQATTGGTGTYIYAWESSLNNTSWTAIASTNTKDYQPAVLTTTTYYRRTVTSGSCSVTSASVKLTVYNLPTSGTMSVASVNTCFGSNVNLSTSGYVGTVKKWQYNFTPGNPATWVDVVASNNAAVSFTNVQQSFSARVIVMQDGTCPNEATGVSIPVTVSAGTVAGTTAADGTVCVNTNGGTITLSGQTGSILRWETSTNSGTTWNTVANTTTSINYLNLTTSTWYRAIVQSGFCPQAISTITKITVVPAVTASNAGTDQSLCVQTVVTLNANNPSVGTGGWSQSSGPVATIVNPALRNTQVSGLQPGQTYKFTWLITGPGTCPSSSDEVQVIVTPAITQSSAGADQLVCSFTGPTDSVTLSGNALVNPGFETSSWVILTPTPAGSTPVIRNSASAVTQFVFNKTGQYQLSRTISNGVCAATKDTVIINVFDKPVTGPLTSSALVGCVGNSFTIYSGSTLKGIIQKWQYNFAAPNPSTWTDTAATGASIVFANRQQSFDARLIVSSTGAGCLLNDTGSIHIEIIPDFTNVIDTTSLSVCPGQSISIGGQLPSGGYNVFAYQWQQSKDGINNWTNIIGQNAVNLTMTPLVTSYVRRVVTVSPCTKNSSPAYIFVRPSVGNFLVSDSVGTCFPFDVTFTNLVLPSTTTTWNFGDGAFNQGDEVTHTYRSTGTFQVVMTAQYPGGCKFEATKNIVVTGPKGIFQYDHQGICVNQPVYFEVASVGIDSVRWNFGDGISLTTTDKIVYHRYAQAGPYVPYAELLAGTGGDCRTRKNGTDTLFVDLVKAGFRQATVQNCAVTHVAFTDTARAFYGVKEWNWSFGDGGLSTTKNPLHDYTAARAWNVRQIVTGNSGCRDTVSKPVTITLWDVPQAKTNKDSVACVGQTVPYEASVSSLDAIKSTVWNFSNGSGSTQLKAPKIYTFPGNYMAVFIATTINDCADTVRLPVTVYPKPEINLGPDLVLATGTLLPLNSVVTNGPLTTWQWAPAADLTCASCNLPVATIKKDITYIVNGETQYGCKASDTMSVKVFCEDAQFFIPNVFTPDGDGLNDVLMVRAKGIRTVKSFRIFNRWGEVVFEKSNFAPNEKSNGWDGTIKGKKASPDVYVYTCEVVCENDISFTRKGNITIVK